MSPPTQRGESVKRVQWTSHGYVGTRTYKAWQRMKNRCNNPGATQYKWYGGRGIRVCQRWNESFLHFLEDMGEAPSPKHTIERIRVNGNYEPNNCEWITQSQQAKNQRDRATTVWLTYKGQTLSVTQWARETGIARHTIFSRLRAGWDTESTLTRKPQSGMSPGGWRRIHPAK